MNQESSRKSRREWLRGSLRPNGGDEAARNNVASRTPLICLAREAMACTFELQFPQGAIDRKVALASFDWIDAVERQLTVYRDDSEIAVVNRAAHREPVSVDRRLFELLVDCLRLWSESGGAFDVTAGPLIAVWGFKRRHGQIPTDTEIENALNAVGMQHIQLDPKANTVRLTRPEMEINFGSVGKGYALDLVADQLKQSGCPAALLGAGGSSIRAIGSLPGSVGWPIDISSPERRGAAALRIRLVNNALSTSASSEQYFEHQGKRYGHILDPRTGRPAEGVRQATIIAPTAARAEAISTAAFVLGPAWTSDYCDRNQGVGAVIFAENLAKPEILGTVAIEAQ